MNSPVSRPLSKQIGIVKKFLSIHSTHQKAIDRCEFELQHLKANNRTSIHNFNPYRNYSIRQVNRRIYYYEKIIQMIRKHKSKSDIWKLL
jgi:hypothetical protein